MSGMVLISADELKAIVRNAVMEALSDNDQGVTVKGKELPFYPAKQIAVSKGYNVKSRATFKNFCEAYGISSRKIGREYWYNAEQLNSIPKKR